MLLSYIGIAFSFLLVSFKNVEDTDVTLRDNCWCVIFDTVVGVCVYCYVVRVFDDVGDQCPPLIIIMFCTFVSNVV